jgi:transposase-like protein
MEMVIQSVSTRRVKKITERLCGRAFSMSTVSRLCEQLDARVEAWAERPLVQTTYPFLMVDAMHVNVRRQGAVRSTTVMLAIGVNEEGYREILGIELSFKETGEAWADFLRQLRERGLRGVEFAVSDAHKGLVEALRERFPGAVWQRCQAHFRRNVVDETPETCRNEMHERLNDVLEADSPEAAREALTVAQDTLDGRADRALKKLEHGFEDATAVLTLPSTYRRRLRTTNSVERFIEEIRRREKVIRIFPNVRSAWRLIGARCAEQHEEWSTGRRYFNMDAYFAWKAALEETAPIAHAA